MEWGFLTPYWLYIAADSQSSGNSGHYQNADFDKTVTEAITSVDPTTVRDKWREANRIIAADAGKLPIYYDRTHYAVGKNVRGFAEAAQDWFDLGEVWLADKQ
jgi:peptide/nickel transport system substrate-binding protein